MEIKQKNWEDNEASVFFVRKNNTSLQTNLEISKDGMNDVVDVRN